MIIILKSDVTEAQIGHVIERVEALGLRAHLSRGTYRTIIGVIGDEQKLRAEPVGRPTQNRASSRWRG
jgi:3-deoxy-7-phosphoheptulonate synthase